MQATKTRLDRVVPKIQKDQTKKGNFLASTHIASVISTETFVKVGAVDPKTKKSLVLTELTKLTLDKSLSPSTDRMIHLNGLAREIARLYHPQRALDREFFDANRYDVKDSEIPIITQLVRDEHGIDSDEGEEIPDLEELEPQTQTINQGCPTPSKRVKRSINTTPLSSPIIRTKNTSRSEKSPARKRSLVNEGKIC